MKYLIKICVITLCLLPFVSSAYSGLIPCSGPDCNYSSLLQLGNNIINYCIVIGTSIFSLVFMYAGYLYLTANGDTGQIGKAHGLFWNAIVGFVIMLSAWLIIDFILTNLIKSTDVSKYRLLGK